MDYLACAEDAAAIRRERLLDLAQRLCLQGYPNLTERRRARLWFLLESFLESCLDYGITAWEGDEDAGDYFQETFSDFDISDRKFERDPDQENKFHSTLNYIARCAFDAVSGFPGGTWGLSIGDFRRIYGGQLPGWWSEGEWEDGTGNPVDPNTVEDKWVPFI